jgi:hypothetical protein
MKKVALPGIEPGSRASETLVLSIVLQGRAANINEKGVRQTTSVNPLHNFLTPQKPMIYVTHWFHCVTKISPSVYTFVRYENRFITKQQHMNTLKKILSFSMVGLALVTACKKSEDTLTNGTLLVLAVTPVNNAQGIIRNTAVSVTFNLPMDTTTINTTTFTLQKGTQTINGTITASGNTFTYTPTDLLEANTLYMASVGKSVKATTGVTLATTYTWSFTTAGATAGQEPVVLGGAGNYVILAKTAINNNPTSAIVGDLGLSPAATSYITGFGLTDATGYATSPQVTGKVFAADMAAPTAINLTTAVNNMITAYNDAAGRPTPDFSELATGNIGGRTLSPGLYKWSTGISIPANITLAGGPNDIWIFQVAGNMNQSAAVNMTLSGGAQAKNIYWQVAGEVTIGTTAHVEGIILCQTGITFSTAASINGRALAQTAVILDGNVVVQPQ